MSKNAQNIRRLASVSTTVEETIVSTTDVMHESVTSVTTSASNSTKIAKDTDKIVDLVTNINSITSENARSVEEIASAADHLSNLLKISIKNSLSFSKLRLKGRLRRLPSILPKIASFGNYNIIILS